MKQYLIIIVVLLANILTQEIEGINDCQVLRQWAPAIFNTADCCSVASLPGVIIHCNPEGRVVVLSMITGALPTGSRIPSNIGELSALSWLDINSNGLVGELPDSFYNLKGLNSLYLYGNKLEGLIKEEFSNFKALSKVGLWDNKFTGLPKSLSEMVSITKLYLKENNFQGSFPDLSKLNLLKECELSGMGLVCLIEGAKLPGVCVSNALSTCKDDELNSVKKPEVKKPEGEGTEPPLALIIGLVVVGILLFALAIFLIVKRKKIFNKKNQNNHEELGNSGRIIEVGDSGDNQALLEVNWVATVDYQKSLSDELDVIQGDHIEVQAFYTDGWVLGINKRTGLHGNIAKAILKPLN
ncbi:hypothetical protein HDU92_009178 [Lobulomyces angularis]|nr:hypothetical protein HDU92_009178 [Lobulomyces angularis]